MPEKLSYAELLKRVEELEARKETRQNPARGDCGDEGLPGKGERHFRDLVENSPTGISIVQDDMVVYRNPEQVRIFGPLKDGPRPSIYERIHPDDGEKLGEMLRSTLSGHAPSEGVDLRFIRLMGETTGELSMKWLHCRSNLIEHQGRMAVLINMLDVTKTKEMERLLNIQDRMTSLGHVAAGIAHDIRNPLSGINIYLDTAEQILEKGGGRESLKEVLEKIQVASSKIESVIKRVLDFSRPSEPKLTAVHISKPIEEALELSSVLLRKTGIELITDHAENLPPCIADSQLIEQVILNLITNAAEAMTEMKSGKKIKLGTSLKDDTIIVSIEDSGPGVPSDLAQKIFEPFLTTKRNSTGIGLSLCQRIINDHGGILSVAPGTLGGAGFSFTVPVSRRQEEAP